MARLAVPADDLPPLDAAARFHAEVLPAARAVLAAEPVLTLIFTPAGHQHRGWRLAAVQELAREAAPARVNAIASADPAAIDAACAWLESAPGVTGQLLPLDSHGAGKVVFEQR